MKTNKKSVHQSKPKHNKKSGKEAPVSAFASALTDALANKK